MQQAFQNFCFAITIYLGNTDRVLKSWNLGSKMRNFISQSYKKNCREIVNVELHFLRVFQVGWQPSQEGRGVAKIVSTGWSWVDLGCAVKNLTRVKRAEEKLTNHIYVQMGSKTVPQRYYYPPTYGYINGTPQNNFSIQYLLRWYTRVSK